MLHTLRSRARDEKGFTLIELLVVILIIGILAAIAIPSFLNQRDKANDAAAKADARTAQTAMETYLTDSADQEYTGATPAGLQTLEPSLANAVSESRLAVTAGSNTYTVTVTSDPTSNTYSIQRQGDGSIVRSCTVASGSSRGGCRADSSW